jgi:hypothetical protein
MYPQKAKRTFDVNDPKFSLFSKFADHFNDIVKISVTHELKAKVQKEIDLGRIVVPFKTLPIDTLQISPVGIVLKSDGKSWRMITHPI